MQIALNKSINVNAVNTEMKPNKSTDSLSPTMSVQSCFVNWVVSQSQCVKKRDESRGNIIWSHWVCKAKPTKPNLVQTQQRSLDIKRYPDIFYKERSYTVM